MVVELLSFTWKGGDQAHGVDAQRRILSIGATIVCVARGADSSMVLHQGGHYILNPLESTTAASEGYGVCRCLGALTCPLLSRSFVFWSLYASWVWCRGAITNSPSGGEPTNGS